MATSIKRILPRVLAGACLLVISVLGTLNGIDEVRSGGAENVLQHSVSVGSLIYGIVGFVAGAGVLLGRRWGYLASIAWGIVITYTGAMASHAYGETTLQVTALAALATAAVAGLVIWLANIGTRNASAARTI